MFDKVHEVDLEKTMKESYIDYAMSVIASRALPDVRDGLKPVQRRVLFSMIELNNGPDKPHRKCARIVGDIMGKYHPHGDSSIYGALVNMAQEWSTRYPLVDGHGNFGSVDGDGPAAMRYTEARLSKISMEMLADIGKDTVDFVPNFDETEKEPTVLPSRYPNLLVNGTSGIAVGMATNIPPHNLREIVAAVVKIIDNIVENNRETTIEELMEVVKGPDFPTGAVILGHKGIEDAYRTGRGKIRVRAVTSIEQLPNGKSRILVTELPYLVNKARLIEKIAELVRDKKIDGITDLNDHSSREGMQICIDLRKDANANVILNQLFKHTQLQDTFGVNMLCLVPNHGSLEPKVLNLKEMLEYYLAHQEEVVTRRTKYDLNKAQERAHILEGLLKALDNIDEVIRIIRAAASVNEAKAGLMDTFALTDVQAQAIVDMRLRALTGLERNRLEEEYKELMAKIEYYQSILADRNLLLGVVKEEISLIAEKYGDDRRTVIDRDVYEISNEDLIPRENVIVTRTHLGYVKRMSPENFHAQGRGGKGIRGAQTVEDDYIEDLFMTTTHHFVLFFTNLGRVYRLKAYEIPEAGRMARGTAIVNLLNLLGGEKITAVICLRSFEENKYLFMATKNGMVKKTPQMDFRNLNKNGLAAINLQEGDELIEVKVTDNEQSVILVTKNGQSVVFKESLVRPLGRKTMGVMGIRLQQEDEVVAMQLLSQGEYLLTVTEYGIGKYTSFSEYKEKGRAIKGIKTHRLTEKSGCLVGAKAVNDDDEVMLITTEGIIIQILCSSIREVGRNSTGVKLMNLGEGVKIASIEKVTMEVFEDEPEEENTGKSEDVMDTEEAEDEESVEDLIEDLLERAAEDAKEDDSSEDGDE